MSGLSGDIASVFYRLAASGLLPAGWFRDVDPATVEKQKRTGKLTLELVSHCCRYSHFLTYQLSSLVRNPTSKFDITMTVFYAEEDEAVKAVLDYFGAMQLEGITWNWQPLPKEKLFRRSIGRNIAAKATKADWIWFTDCDILFHERCLDTLADELQGRDDSLVYLARSKARASMGFARLARFDRQQGLRAQRPFAARNTDRGLHTLRR